VGSKPMVALSLARLPGDSGQLVLATGGLDHKVHLYCGDSTGKVCKLYIPLSYFVSHGLFVSFSTEQKKCYSYPTVCA